MLVFNLIDFWFRIKNTIEMKKVNYLKAAILLITIAVATSNLQAQKKKMSLKERMKAAKEKLEQAANGTSGKEAEEEVKEEKPLTELNAWHKANEGKVVFYNKSIVYKSKSTSDSETNVITERVIGENKPFSFRAYMGKPCSGKENCFDLDIKYTIDGVSITTKQLREELPQYYSRMASMASFTDRINYTVGVPLTAAKGEYPDQYTLQEDAYRILLSKVKDKLKMGTTVTLKVEIFELGNLIASGEIPLKVTAESKNLQNLNCRCGKEGLSDASIEKDIKEAFKFQLDDVEEVHHVVLLERDWRMNYDNSYPTKQIIAKGMNANIVYTRSSDGVTMMNKNYVFYDKTPSGFADKIKIGKNVFYLPVSPTCGME